MIEKQLDPTAGAVAAPIEVVIEEPEENIVFEFGEPEEATRAFDENLAEYIEDTELALLANDLIRHYQHDRDARKDWMTAYEDGLKYLGFKPEEKNEPWPGAFGAYHPMLAEAAIRFQAQTIMEIFPASGPVRGSVVGEFTNEMAAQAQRCQNEMNYQLTENMEEYRAETEQMLFHLPLAGSAFKKVYYDAELRRPCSMFCPAEDIIVPYGTSDLRGAHRVCQVMRRGTNWIRRRQVAGLYIVQDIPEADAPETTSLRQTQERLAGESPTGAEDDIHVLLEYHIELNLPGYEDPDGIALPYVVTVDMQTRSVLAIYRNWIESDDRRHRRDYYIHYQYMPGLGFYGTGLIHLIGGLAKSATSVLRQLVDAGTLSNLPGGFKARGFRVDDDSTPIMPGEWRDVDVVGGNIRDSLAFLPYKEPSSVLYNLLNNIVEEGRRIGSVADMKIAESQSQGTPVGTTLAVIERAMKVMSAVQARVHAAQRQEMKLIAQIIHDHMPPEYDYDNGPFVRRDDFDGRIDVLPVTDPNASSTAMKAIQYQEAIRLSELAPDLYDKPTLHREMLKVLNIPNADKIVPSQDEISPMDPVAENMAIMTGEPVKAHEYQDHEAHIRVHMAAAQDPKIREVIGQSPHAAAIEGAMVAHITEHVAFEYRRNIEEQLGTPLPPMGQQLPEDVEAQYSSLVANAADKLLQQNMFEAEQEENRKKLEDPVIQNQMRDLDIREREVIRKEQADKLEHERELYKINSEEKRDGMELGVEIMKSQDQMSADQHKAGMEIGAKIGEQLTRSREQSAGDGGSKTSGGD